MTKHDSSPSPHYFAIENQESPDFRSDDPTATPVTIQPVPRLKFRTPAHHPRRKAIKAALEALKIVADRDADYARTQNGEGFSKSDSSQGHMLSEATIEDAMQNDKLAERILWMAARYRRQVLRLQQMDLI
ncbi:hypothetical protein [Sinorhizobium fredii]|uniref:Uncharacterized protein n=1 Tax=Rhizobium fredii TaxID=380 RepID=A0A2L0H436_RHIFR|nr:hypothetical protein [Sinorhizobium fredii]AUX76230.1 hypothetical protein NXT3_CH01655 [Sinorhizobium fredii]